MKEEQERRPIDNVTTDRLHVALKLVGVDIHTSILDKVIDLVELIEDKGGDASIDDIVSLKENWNR